MYRKETETKIIRTTHIIGFYEGTTRAIDLKQSLAKVPDQARIKCLLDNVANADYEIWFEEEKPDC